MFSTARRPLAASRVTPRTVWAANLAAEAGRTRIATSDVEQPTRIAARTIAARDRTHI